MTKLCRRATRLQRPSGSRRRCSPAVSRDKPIRFDLIWRLVCGVYECHRSGGDPYGELLCEAFGSLSSRSPPVPHRTCVTPHTRFHVATIAFPFVNCPWNVQQRETIPFFVTADQWVLCAIPRWERVAHPNSGFTSESRSEKEETCSLNWFSYRGEVRSRRLLKRSRSYEFASDEEDSRTEDNFEFEFTARRVEQSLTQEIKYWRGLREFLEEEFPRNGRKYVVFRNVVTLFTYSFFCRVPLLLRRTRLSLNACRQQVIGRSYTR